MNKPSTVIITGASSGLGFALAEAFLERGDNVVGNARSQARLEQAAARLGHPSRFVGVAGDIAQAGTAQRLFATALQTFGGVDMLINNAGIFIAKPFAEYSEADVDALVGTNLKGFFYPAQEAARIMTRQGYGQIIAITASIALQPNTRVPALLPVLVKGGLNQAVKGLALEPGGQRRAGECRGTGDHRNAAAWRQCAGDGRVVAQWPHRLAPGRGGCCAVPGRLALCQRRHPARGWR